jgi:hypothetical protein
MKRFILFFALSFALCFAVSRSAAQTLLVPRCVFGSGGVETVGALNRINGTVGQTAIGIVQHSSNNQALGFWYTKNAGITPVESVSAAQDFYLGQSHPNPLLLSSQQTAMLEYRLAAPLDVELSVYDQVGRKIAVLLSGMQSPGSYAAHFSPDAGVPSGLYHVVMKTTSASGIMRMQSRVVVLIR